MQALTVRCNGGPWLAPEPPSFVGVANGRFKSAGWSLGNEALATTSGNRSSTERPPSANSCYTRNRRMQAPDERIAKMESGLNDLLSDKAECADDLKRAA
jgi:hypothetical protein